MENISRALLIVGGLLISVVITSAVIFMYRDLTKFKSEELELEKMEDVTKFNKSFQSFAKSNITGAQLLSLANKMDDYNRRITPEGNTYYFNTIRNSPNIPDASHKKGIEGYEYIVLQVDDGISRTIGYYGGLQSFVDNIERDYQSVSNFETLYEAINTFLDTSDETYRNSAEYTIKEIIKNLSNRHGIDPDPNTSLRQTDSNIIGLRTELNRIYNGTSGQPYSYQLYKELKNVRTYTHVQSWYSDDNGRIVKMQFRRN